MDTRDQSFYPREVIRDYFAIMGLLHESEPDRMRLLDKYSVDLVVMTTEPYDFKLALTLAKNSAWGCVYYDDYSIVLVRTESPRFHDMLNEVNFRNLWYPDEDTRIRSEALHAHSKHIQVPPYLIDKLKLIVERHPRPNLYRLISWGEGYPRGCLQEATTRFLLSEAARLSGISPLYAHGAEEITQSLMAIWEILATSAQNCGNENARMKFEQLRQRCASEFEVMSRKYLGPPF